MRLGLTDQEIKEFLKFATGSPYTGEIRMGEIFTLWNTLHYDKLKLDGSSEIVNDLHKMIVIWKKTLKN